MAYSIYYDLVGGLSGSADNHAVTTYTTTWRVAFDSPIFDVNYVGTLPELPSLWSVAPNDPLAILARIEPRQTEDPSVWDVGLTWSRISSDQRQFAALPLDRPPNVSWGSVPHDKPLVTDINGKMVGNSAGDKFNPPETVDDPRMVARCRYNLSYVPSFLLDYRGKTNNAPFTLEGIFVDVSCARVASIEISEWKNEQNQYYREVIVIIELIDPYPVANGVYPYGAVPRANLQVQGWQKAILDEGYRYIASGPKLVKALDDNGMETAQPVLLNGSGGKLSTPVTSGSEVYIVYDVLPQRDFSLLNLPA
jgi:hypothetical protein